MWYLWICLDLWSLSGEWVGFVPGLINQISGKSFRRCPSRGLLESFVGKSDNETGVY